MVDSKQIRKLVFLNETEFALVIFNSFNGKNNILYSNQTKIENCNFKHQIQNLLKNANEFLGFNISEVELVFDDFEISTQFCENEKILCQDQKTLIAKIYENAKNNNQFINWLQIKNISFNKDIACFDVDYQKCVSNYNTYDAYLTIVKESGLIVRNSTNLYFLSKHNDVDSQLVINIDNNKIIAMEYQDNSLFNVKKMNNPFEKIKDKICKTLKCEFNKINAFIDILNNLNFEDNNLDIWLDYDFFNKKINKTNSDSLIRLYQNELANEINNIFSLKNFSNVKILSNNKLNLINNMTFLEKNKKEIDILIAQKNIANY